MAGDKRFIFTRAGQVASDPDGHGSCVASKVAGPRFGVAKNANVVMVMLPGDMRSGDILTALFQIRVDVISRGLQGKAVVNMSFGCKYINPCIGELDLTSTKFFLEFLQLRNQRLSINLNSILNS
jgi:hypothetical protein